jgi:hypothetical protein
MSGHNERHGAGRPQLRRRVDRRAERRFPLDVDGAPQKDARAGGVTEREQRVNDRRLGDASRIAPDRVVEEPGKRRDQVGRERRQIRLSRGARCARDDVVAAVGQRLTDERQRGRVAGSARGVAQRLQGFRHPVALHRRAPS